MSLINEDNHTRIRWTQQTRLNLRNPVLSKNNTCWTAPLPFPCQLRMCDGLPLPLCSNTYEEQNLNAFIASAMYGRSFRLYFDPTSYPPPTGQADQTLSDQNRAIFEQMKVYLQMAAFKNGQSFICNGSTSKTAPNQIF